MATESTRSRLDEHSLIGTTTSLVAVVVSGVIASSLHAPMPVQTAVVATAAGLPSAIGYRLASTRRDKSADIARLEQGYLDRPIGLVVVMLAAVIFLADMIVGTAAKAASLVITVVIGIDFVTISGFLSLFLAAIVAAALFFIASFASHYLGEHPYIWSAVAVGLGIGLEFLTMWFLSSENVLVGAVELSLIYLFVCLAGAWFGRRNHERFLANKLLRIRQQSSHAVDRPSTTPRTLDQLPPPNARERRLE